MKKQPVKKFAITEAVLWILKMFAPLVFVVVVEQSMGPGSTAKANQIFLPVLLANLILGAASYYNLFLAMNSSPPNETSD